MKPLSIKLIFAFCLALVIGIPVLTRPYYQSHSFLSSAREFVAKGDTGGAIAAYRSSISWRTPFNSFAADSSHELFAICHQESLSSAMRLEYLEQLKRGLSVSRSIWWALPGAWRGVAIEQVEQEISVLSPSPPIVVREAHPPFVNFSVQLVAQLFFWSWVGMVFFTIWSEFDRSGTLKRSSRVTFAAKALGCIASFAGWLTALAFA